MFFQPGADPGTAMNDIVNLEANDFFHLPPGIEQPFTLRSEPANLPVILAAISGEGLSETELYKIGYYAVRNKMGGLKGVQIPHPFGGKFRQMMVYVDPARLRAFNLSATDVVEAVRKSNLVLAARHREAGRLRISGASDRTRCPHRKKSKPCRSPSATANRSSFAMWATSKDDAAIQYNIVRVNGSRSVYCPLLREPGENTIAVVDRIYEGIAKEIPDDESPRRNPRSHRSHPRQRPILLYPQRDAEPGLRSRIGGLLGGHCRGGLSPARAAHAGDCLRHRACPCSSAGWAFTSPGNTINVMTLGGIALAIGTVVDAGIVVVENVIRHLKMGKSPADAARDGAGEVSMPILAGTITTLAVFIPAIFLSGMIKYLFEPLSVAATMTIGASYFIAMTVMPAFCARFIREKVSRTIRSETDSDGRHRPPARGFTGIC